MRVLITGSAGFIGSHLVERLMRGGHAVLGLDIRPVRHEGAEFIHCDILNAEATRRAFTDFAPDSVMHLAARTDLEGATLADYAANVEGVRNVVEAVAATPSVKRAIYTSTQLVCRVGYVPRTPDDYSPSNLYGASKVEGEKIVRGLNGGGVEWCITRPTTIWGPGMNAHYQRFMQMIRQGRYVHVGRRPLLKTYGYVGNVAYEYDKLTEAPAHSIAGKTFYVADYEPLDLRLWADALQAAFGAAPIRTIPRPVARALAIAGDVINAAGVKRFPFNSFRLRNILTEYQFDMSELRSVCGPLPFSFEDGVARTAGWFRGLGRAGE